VSFWTELAPGDHVMHLYDGDGEAVEVLADFVSQGLQGGEGVIVIATEGRRAGLERRLQDQGLDLAAARREERYLPVDAEQALGRFLLENWPDEILFERMVRELVARVKGKERRVRAYGEMVALLWGRGHRGATARLEQLWHRLCRSEDLALFCAYPQTALVEGSDSSVRKIRELHSRVLAGRQLA